MIRLLVKLAGDKTKEDFWKGFCSGLSLVFVSGFCDKTFFLNMIYVSIKPFWEAFFISLLISELMNIISVSLGKVIPMIVSREILDWCAICIFLAFGIAMLIQGLAMKTESLNSSFNKEKEHQIEIEDEKKQLLLKPTEEKEIKKEEKLGVFDTWWKYCIAYMIGELGDKSQIATIVVTSKYNFYGVFGGTAMAQLLLVFFAMVLGKSIAGMLTNRQISLLGAVVFILFALIYLVEKSLTLK